MFSLRQEVGSDKLYVGLIVGDDADFRGTSGHVDGHVVEAHLLLGGHHILVARTEYLIHLRHRLRTIGHCTDSLHATCLEYLADTGDAGSHKDGGIHLAVASRGCAEHDLFTAGNLGWCGKHQYGREEWGGATGDIETDLLDGDALLPAYHTGLSLYLLSLEYL